MAACRIAPMLALTLLVLAPASAQDPRLEETIAVLVSTAPGAPTPEDLIEYYHGSQTTPPPLRGLRIGRPKQIAYLLSVRAQGDFRTSLEEHPDSVRAQLERYVVVLYPEGTHLEEPLAALRSDPYVTAAYRYRNVSRRDSNFCRLFHRCGAQP